MTRIEEERIDEMLADAISERDRPIIGDGALYDFHPSELVNALQELKELRAQGGVRVADLDDYDAGLLGSYGGGDVDWWQDYLRAEIGRANDFWREQLSALETEAAEPVAWGWKTNTSDDWHYAEKVCFSSRDKELGFVHSITPLYAHPAVSPIPTVTGDAETLRSALADLVSWFDGGPSRWGPWIIEAGELGADEAVEAARAALSSESKP